MANRILFYLGAFFTFAWGAAHLVPTRSILRGFGGVNVDNSRIVAMEWITEGVALIFTGIMLLAVTLVDPEAAASKAVFWSLFGMLNTLSIVSLFTGFKIAFLPFKLCPFIFTGSSILIVLGMYV